MISLRQTQAGFTIVELVISMTLIVILGGGIVGFTVSKLVQSTLQTAKSDMLNDAQLGLDSVANDIRLSSKADTNNRWQDSYAPNAPSDPLSWQSNATTLVLATSAQDSSQNILFDDKADYITTKNNLIYFTRSGTLYRRLLAAPVANNAATTTCPAASASATCPADKVLLTNVSQFTVQYFDSLNQEVSPSDARSIQLTVQLQATKYGTPLTVRYTTRMVFRNG